MHFCMDEVYAILMCVPFVGWAVAWVRSRIAMWRGRHEKPCCVHTPEAIHGESGALYAPVTTHALIGPGTMLCDEAAFTADASVGSYHECDVTCSACLYLMYQG